jgi:hypothetical protein
LKLLIRVFVLQSGSVFCNGRIFGACLERPQPFIGAKKKYSGSKLSLSRTLSGILKGMFDNS